MSFDFQAEHTKKSAHKPHQLVCHILYVIRNNFSTWITKVPFFVVDQTPLNHQILGRVFSLGFPKTWAAKVLGASKPKLSAQRR